MISKGKFLVRKNKASGKIIVKIPRSRDVLMSSTVITGNFISRLANTRSFRSVAWLVHRSAHFLWIRLCARTLTVGKFLDLYRKIPTARKTGRVRNRRRKPFLANFSRPTRPSGRRNARNLSPNASISFGCGQKVKIRPFCTVCVDKNVRKNLDCRKAP